MSPKAYIARRLPFDLTPPKFGGTNIAQQYVGMGKSAKQIAREVGCSHTTVVKHLRAEGIGIKGTRPNYIRGQVGYGRKAINGSELDSKKKLEIIARMKSLRLQRFSYHKIADILNTMKIQTKSKKARWHATTILKILKAIL